MSEIVTNCFVCHKALSKNQIWKKGKFCSYSCSGKTRKHSPELNKQTSENVRKLWQDPEYRRHMVQAHKGKPPELHPQWRGGKPNCTDCGKQLVKRTAKRCRPCFAITQLGESGSNWQGGKTEISKRIRNSGRYKRWRKEVFTRDNFTCVNCLKRGGDLQADHIRPFAFFPELRFELSNGRTLCKPCHYKTDTFGSGLNYRRYYL